MGSMGKGKATHFWGTLAETGRMLCNDLKNPEVVVFGLATGAAVDVPALVVNFFSNVGPFLEGMVDTPAVVLLEFEATEFFPSPTATFFVALGPTDALESSSPLRLMPTLRPLLPSLLIAIPFPATFSLSPLVRAGADAVSGALFCFSLLSLIRSSLSFLARAADFSLAALLITAHNSDTL